MQYREKILELIVADDDDAFMSWVSQQPLVEQPDIMREFKQLMAELLKAKGATEELENLNELDAYVENYEEAILDEQLALLKYEIAKDDADKKMNEMLETVVGMREYVIECIVTNADNAKEMRALAQHIIHFEKEAGTFDAKNWEAIM